MKLTIDTAADSREEIEQVIRLLQALVASERSGHSKEMQDFPSGENVLGSLFNADPGTKTSEEKKEPGQGLTFGIQTY
jgi:hypothetical protein